MKPQKPAFDASSCVMTKVMEAIGGKWKPVILFLIENGINRFSLLMSYIPTVSRKILTEQLRELEASGLIKRAVQGTKPPLVVTYSLTQSGLSLRKVLDQLIAWGFEHLLRDVNERLLHGQMKERLNIERDLFKTVKGERS